MKAKLQIGRTKKETVGISVPLVRVSLLVFFQIFATLHLSAETFSIKGITIDVPNDYDFSWYDGDSEKLVQLRSERAVGSVHVTLFRKLGNAEVEYNPAASDVKNIEDFLSGKTVKLGNFYPHNNRTTFLPKLPGKVLDSLVLCEFTIDDIQFIRRVIFTDDIYCYVVTISLKGMETKLPQELGEFFQKQRNGKVFEWRSVKLDSLKQDYLLQKSLPVYLEKLLGDTADILATLRKKI